MLSPLLKKELFLLKGPVLAGCALTGLLWAQRILIHPDLLPYTTWAVVLFALMLSYTITAAFGHEMAEHAFGWWLAQPRSRRDLWKEKIKPTVYVYLGLCLMTGLSMLWIESTKSEGDQNGKLVTFLMACILGCFGPGIYFTLRLRNAAASFWATVIMLPLLISVSQWLGEWMVTGLSLQPATARTFHELWFLAWMTGYAIWGLWAARRAFLNWEDTGRDEGGLPVLLQRSKSAVEVSQVPVIKRSAIRTLLVRELRMQQTNIVTGLILFFLVWVTHYWSQRLMNRGEVHSEFHQIVALMPMVFRYLIFIVPFSIAAVSIAELRRQDVHTWERMLPVASWKQFGIKATCILGLTWMIAAGLPMHFDQSVMFAKYQSYSKSIAVILPHLCAIIIGGLSLYVSSLSSGFLRSFSFSLGILPVLGFFWAFQMNLESYDNMGFVVGLFIVPTIIMTLWMPLMLYWSFANFKAPHILKQHVLRNVRHWGWSALVVGLWIAFMMDRSWERWSLPEPKQAATLLQGSTRDVDAWQKEYLFTSTETSEEGSEQVTVQPSAEWLGTYHGIALRSDGQLLALEGSLGSHWTQSQNGRLNRPLKLVFESPEATGIHPMQVSQFTSGFRHRLIIDFEGHLWNWNYNQELAFIRDHRAILPSPILPEQRFRKLINGGKFMAALDDEDGLWMTRYLLNENGKSYSRNTTEWKRSFGANRWHDAIWSHRGFLGLKEDKSLWTYKGSHWSDGSAVLDDAELPDTVVPVFPGRSWNAIGINDSMLLLEEADGSLWVETMRFHRRPPGSAKVPQLPLLCRLESADIQKMAYFSAGHDEDLRMTYLKKDGTLWRGIPDLRMPASGSDHPPTLSIIKAKQLGHRSDWVAVHYYAGMTADGKIWNWNQNQTNPWNPFPARQRHKTVADLAQQP